MDEIGSILLEAREAKGLTIAEVHEKLRISKQYLKALEQGQYHQLPSNAHVRGYLRNYARFLGLSPEPLLERFEAVREQSPAAPLFFTPKGNGMVKLIEPTPEEPIPPLAEPETGTFHAHANMPVGVGSTSSGSDWIGRLIVLALIAAIAIIGYARFGPALLKGDTESFTEEVRTAVNDVINGGSEPAAVPDSPLLLTTPLTSTIVITSTSRTTGSNGVVATVTPTRSPLPATMDTVDLQIDVTERTWLRVVADGITVYEGQARKGEVLNWTASNQMQLRTGNAAGLFVTINGIELGRLGERGQVVDQVWETTR